MTLLDDPVTHVTAVIRNISDGGLQVSIDEPRQIGAALRLEVDDVALYGHIRYCSPSPEGYVVGVCVDLILLGGNELTCAVEDLLEYWATANNELPVNTSSA